MFESCELVDYEGFIGMKLLFLTFNLTDGGAEIQLKMLVNAIVEHYPNVEVNVLFISKEGDYDTAGYSNKVIFHQIQTPSNYSFGIFLKTIAVIRRVQPNLIQSWCYQFDILLPVIALLMKD
mgnify:CR=1 FL=1